MRKFSVVRTLLITALLLASPAASWAQGCTSPPSGFGGAWARQYAAWCQRNGGTYDPNGPKCTPGPNWCGRQQTQRSAPPVDTSSADEYVEQHRRAAAEKQRQQQEEELQREQAAEAERNQQFEKAREQALSDVKDVTEVDPGVRIPALGGLGLKRVGNAEPAAWDARIANPEIARIAKGLDEIHVPPPLPHKEASLTWQQLASSTWTTMGKGEDIAFLTWDLLGKFGDKAPLHVKVILIAGKVLLDGEDGAYIHLVKRDELYENALHYLKDPATSRQFAEIVRDVKKTGHAPESADPGMVRAARAIVDPSLGSSGTRIAFDAMMSPEAVAAMARKACLEAGAEMVGTGTEGLLGDLTKRKELYEAARIERDAARTMLKQTTAPLEKEQLNLVVTHANQTLANIYRLERVGPVVASDLVAVRLGNEVEAATEASHTPEK